MTVQSEVVIKRALISVSDKTGIVDFASALADAGIEIISTGGTFKIIQEAGIDVTEISDYTKFPEMMAGRVKTLHPKVHGGILARRGTDDEVMKEHNIPPIDMVVVNLYPFQATIAKPDCSFADAIENIDIGGPTMLRAAAKNHAHVSVVVDPKDYSTILNELANKGTISGDTRYTLAVKTFEHTARYDGAIANYLGTIPASGENNPEKLDFPETFNFQYLKKQEMRYGENPHQKAAFYIDPDNTEPSISTSIQIQGKALSYNNIADTDAALECVKCFDEPACVIVKHANPCGVATAGNPKLAYEKAYKTDPTSAFGGIIAFNRELDEETASLIISQQFSEVIIAPSVTDAAARTISNKENIRLLTCGYWNSNAPVALDYKKVIGGLLIQNLDQGVITANDLNIVTKRQPSEEEIRDLLFAWKVVKFVKSNAIVYTRDQQTIGIGAGQMSRVYSARIAGIKAEDEGLKVKGSVMASDAFFPFSDTVEGAAAEGITAIIQPGGSMRDDEVIAAADAAGMAMVFTGMRHFRH